jgi:hypothetical protein
MHNLGIKWAGSSIVNRTVGQVMRFRCTCSVDVSAIGAEVHVCRRHRALEAAAHESLAEQYGACVTRLAA